MNTPSQYRGLLLFFWLFPVAVAAEPELPLFSSYYSIYIIGLKVAEGVRELKRNGAHQFVFTSHSHTTGVAAILRADTITERSLWQWQDGHIQPLRYVFHHAMPKKQKHSELDFDWPHNLVRFEHQGKQGELAIQPGVLDQSVYQLALMSQLARHQPTDIVYTIASGDKLKPYALTFQGEETIKIPLGEFRALKFNRVDEDNRRSAMWCAPDLAYLPIRVEHQEPKGEKVTMLLDRVSGIGTK